jgi:hypothetical protein
MAGENLAVDFEEAENVEDAWMNSPGHRANILNKEYEDIGIGIAQGTFQGHNSIFVVQMFGTKAEQKVATLDTPTKVAQPQPAPAPAVKSAEKKSLFNTASADAPAPSPEATGPIAISDTTFTISGDHVVIRVLTLGPVSKVTLSYGGAAAMLDPKENGIWETKIAMSKLRDAHGGLVARAFDMKGNLAQQQAASFYSDVAQNYNPDPVPAAKNNLVHAFGVQLDPKAFESKFYLLFIAGILSALIIAIAVKRHVQHISLIANSSFVVILATLLWLGT